MGQAQAVDKSALVRQLRDTDAYGAPLLFQACIGGNQMLELVKKLVEGNLGVGGLMEQLRALDTRGRDIFMYAAKRGDVFIVEKVKEIL